MGECFTVQHVGLLYACMCLNEMIFYTEHCPSSLSTDFKAFLYLSLPSTASKIPFTDKAYDILHNLSVWTFAS